MSNHPTILSALGNADPEIAERLVSRRAALMQGGSASAIAMAGLRLGSVPVALAALSSEAFGQGRLPAIVSSVLNFALRLEYLEAEFYNTALARGVIPSEDLTIFQTIAQHENDHVAFLQRTLGSQARPKPTFDFSAGNGSGTGPFATVFTDYNVFKAVAQAFEDTGVRAYKGQAANLLPYKDVLQAALTIHSVEARHAAEVRRLRGNFQDQEPNQGWITLNLTDTGAATQAVYDGEENVVHLGINVPSITPVAAKEVSEAFDEPLTMSQVLAIVDPFIV